MINGGAQLPHIHDCQALHGGQMKRTSIAVPNKVENWWCDGGANDGVSNPRNVYAPGTTSSHAIAPAPEHRVNKFST